VVVHVDHSRQQPVHLVVLSDHQATMNGRVLELERQAEAVRVVLLEIGIRCSAGMG
jgi:hypothetical protein